MADIIRIVIKGTSGFGSIDNAYHDKVTVTPDFIAYEYTPYRETAAAPKRKWRCQTNSPTYQAEYDKITAMLPKALAVSEEAYCTDIGSIEFNITYADKTKLQKTYRLPGEYFGELFTAIKALVPSCKPVPAVLRTSED